MHINLITRHILRHANKFDSEEEKFLSDIGTKVKNFRVYKNIKLTTLTQKAGVDYRTLKAIETGRANPTILVLNKIAKALETNVTILTDVNYNTNTIDTRKSLIDLVYSLNQKQFKILNNAVSLLCEHPYQFWKRIRDVVMKDYEERINEIELWEFYSKKNKQ